MQEQKISEKIKAKWTDEGICVEMPEDLAAELESVLVERYGIGIEEALRRYLQWITEKPEEFKQCVKESGEYGTLT